VSGSLYGFFGVNLSNEGSTHVSRHLLISLILLVWALTRFYRRYQQAKLLKQSANDGTTKALEAEGSTLDRPTGTVSIQTIKTRSSASERAYAASGILGLSSTELRARALKINPYKTPWIGRVDTIPPQTDERTALIDRGLILRGLLTQEQIQEIHRVGDEWLRVHESFRLAEALGKSKADEVLAEQKAARVARKERLRQEARLRKEERQQAILLRKATDIVFAGRGVSHQLSKRDSNTQALNEAGLPLLITPADLAQALGITVPELRWLTYHHDCPERTHYVYFSIPKRSGGTRLLASPKRHLRLAQRWVFEQVLSKLSVTESAHGFVENRSTLTNALPHVNRFVVVNLDLKDFFPSITFARVRGLFSSLGYSEAVATLLALLCTESPRTEVTYEERKYWAAVGERALPQGACTSPFLSNLITRKLDRRLKGSAEKLDFSYTRYADDLTFSASSKKCNVPLLLSRVRHIITEEGFIVNENKGRVQRRGHRQEVTGVVVNDRPGVCRDEVRRIRAILHNARKTGLTAQNRDGHPHFEAWLRGKIGYVAMLDPEKGKALAAEMDQCTA
jgi:RNA-directed DNA polymerase